MTDQELDALVAERVMGWRDVWAPGGRGVLVGTDPQGNQHQTGIPPYSIDIAAAWQVVDKMQALGWNFQLHSPGASVWCDGCETWSQWGATFQKDRARFNSGSPLDDDNETKGPAHAIVLAALKAVGVEVPA